MNYKRIYDLIVERAKTRQLEGYKEKHHIVPKFEGGTDDKANLVELTAREHLLVHWLYARHTKNFKAYFAFKCMLDVKTPDQKRKNGSIRMAAEARENSRDEEWKKRSRDWNTGRKHTEETKAFLKENWKKFHSNDWSEERKINLASKQKGKPFYNASGTRWVNNGVICKMVKVEDIERFIQLGFSVGRLKKNS